MSCTRLFFFLHIFSSFSSIHLLVLSFISFVCFIKCVQMENNIFNVSVVESWQLAHKNMENFRRYCIVHVCRKMPTNGYRNSTHAITFKWVGFIVCSQKSTYFGAKSFCWSYIYFFAVFLHFRFVFSLLLVAARQRLDDAAWEDAFLVCCYCSYSKFTSGGNRM